MNTVHHIIDRQIKTSGHVDFDILKDEIQSVSLTEDDISSILIWADSFNRFPIFLKFKDQIHKPAIYWKALREAYQGSDNLFKWKHEISECFLSNKPQRECLMNEDEHKTLSSLPDQLKVYRGMAISEAESENFGISWTLKRETAEYFAFTYGRNQSTDHMGKTVVSIDIKKDQILAYFNGRNEDEIIIKPPQP